MPQLVNPHPHSPAIFRPAASEPDFLLNVFFQETFTMPRTLRCKLTETHWHHPLVNLTEHSPCHQIESSASMRNPSFLIPASRACPMRLGKQIGQLRRHCCCNWKEDGPLLWEYFTWAWLHDMYLMYILLTIYLKSPSPSFSWHLAVLLSSPGWHYRPEPSARCSH